MGIWTFERSMVIKMGKDTYQIDTRDITDIYERIEELAASYVPEWYFSTEDPDVGSVLAMLMANQIRDNVLRFNQVLLKYHTELVNLLGLSLRPANPACAIVLMELAQDTVQGIDVAKGTKLLGENGQKSIVFETTHPVHITNAKLAYIFMASKQGKIIPLQEKKDAGIRPFSLFDDTGKGIDRTSLQLCHSTFLDGKGQRLGLLAEDGGELIQGIREKRYVLQYDSTEGMRPVEALSIEGNTLWFTLEQACRRVADGQEEYAVLSIEALQRPQEGVEAAGFFFLAGEDKQPPDFVHNATSELSRECFAPFGDVIRPYAACYIGHASFFAKAGAKMQMQFEVTFPTHTITTARPQEQLKLVKRKPAATIGSVVEDAFADEISMDYFNGLGWKRLPLAKEAGGLFATAKKGQYTLEFVCPRDWKPISVGGYEQRCIRMQVIRSEHCYLQPCTHHYPLIWHLTLSYDGTTCMEPPERLFAVTHLDRVDLTGFLGQKKKIPVFLPNTYTRNVLLLGFHKRLQGGPVSLLVELENSGQSAGRRIGFAYSTAQGMKPLKVVDHTRGMTVTGTILFRPPEDMAALKLEGRRYYWLELIDLEEEEAYKPRIKSIRLNAVAVHNIETHREEAFYLDEVIPGRKVVLGSRNILSAQVWVNEQGQLTQEQKEQLLRREPNKVRASYNGLGEIEQFFVKWEEVSRFDTSGKTDRHYILDRLSGRICFGDGVHVAIPRQTNGIAFLVSLSCCDGSLGNVTQGAIKETAANLMLIKSIYNPAPAFGGSDMESIPRILKRGAAMLSSHDRLISEQDYVQAALAYSDAIAQAKCIRSKRIEVILLMQDHEKETGSFERVRAGLLSHMQKHCELTVAIDEIDIVEPLFVKINVQAWIEVIQTQNREEGFALQELYQSRLREYFDPIAPHFSNKQSIGVIPDKTQIMMKLNAIQAGSRIRRILITASYQDQNGIHETELDRLAGDARAVCISGMHRIHVRMACRKE